jgi:phosphate transport system substrate-binding protein
MMPVPPRLVAVLRGLSAVLALAAALPLAAAAQQISGAGATFPAPLYVQWATAAAPATGLTLDYQAIGSAGGQQQILNRTVDFGASDAPVDADTLTGADLLQVPTVVGAVVVIVNIPGVGLDQMRLTGPLLAEIYVGTITSWDDPALAAVNPGLNLPHLAITPVHRADGSGTTFVWTSYLSAVSPAWKQSVGAATSVTWPVGSGAHGNAGVAGSVGGTPGAIGYVESTYALQNNLITTQLRNKAGAFVAPSLDAFTAAAAQADWLSAKNFAVSIIDMPGAASWPIVSTTFVLIPRHPDDPASSQNVEKFLAWAYENGGGIATGLHYVPLPAAVQQAALAAMRSQIDSP